MEKKCLFCNKIFKTYDKRQRFCSRSCGQKNRSNNKKIVASKCKFCSMQFIVQSGSHGRKLFCSLQCFHKWNTRDEVRLICENCGIEYYKPPAVAKNRRNCSKKCKYELLGRENSKRFKGIKLKKLEERRQLDVYRQKALSALPNQCFICDSTTNKLEVHHKNGKRSDNMTSNLMILCRGCHRRVHNTSLKYSICLCDSLNVHKIIGQLPKNSYRIKAVQERIDQEIKDLLSL